jgi:hypothetical protein
MTLGTPLLGNKLGLKFIGSVGDVNCDKVRATADTAGRDDIGDAAAGRPSKFFYQSISFCK